MTPIVTQLNSIRDPKIVERILIANSRTEVLEVYASDFSDIGELRLRLGELKGANKPFVVRGGARDWKLIERFSDFPSLISHAKLEQDLFPDRKYTSYKPEKDGHLNQSHAAPYGYLSFHQFLTKGKQKGLYLLGVPDKAGRGASPFEMRKAETKRPIFADDIDSDPKLAIYLRMFENNLASRRHIFFNSTYSFTNLHYDTDWNMYLCAMGKRRWTLAHPAHAALLGAASGGANYSLLMPTKGLQGLSSSRLAHLVKFVSVDLDPSDLLFVPPTWWHVVEGLLNDFSCGVNWFFTFPEISTESPLDVGWSWMNTNERLVIPSSMGMGMASVRIPESDMEEENPDESRIQPDGAGHNLQRCSSDAFLDLVRRDVMNEMGTPPQEFDELEKILRSNGDSLLGNQLLQIALNSILKDGVDRARFGLLCAEIGSIMAKRRKFAIRPEKRKRSFKSEKS
jgi:hypothetical protein